MFDAYLLIMQFDGNFPLSFIWWLFRKRVLSVYFRRFVDSSKNSKFEKILKSKREMMVQKGIFINRYQSSKQKQLFLLAKKTIDKKKVRVNYRNLKTQILKHDRWCDIDKASDITEPLRVYGRRSNSIS